MALTNTAENRTLNWLTGQTDANAPVAPVLPLRVALTTTVGDDATPGTEVTGGGYARQSAAFSAASNGQSANSAVVRFDNMPDVPLVTAGDGSTTGGVRGFEVWDSAATPVRWWYAALTTPRGYQAGDAAEFPANQLVLALE